MSDSLMSNDNVSQTPIMFFVYSFAMALLIALLCTTRTRRLNREKYRAHPTLWRILSLDQWVLHNHSLIGMFVASSEELEIYPLPARAIILMLKLETIYTTSVFMPLLNPGSFGESEDALTLDRALESVFVAFVGTMISITMGIPLFKKSFKRFRDTGWHVWAGSCLVLALATVLNAALTLLPTLLPGYSLNLNAVLTLWGSSLAISWIVNEPITSAFRALVFLESAVPVGSGGNGQLVVTAVSGKDLTMQASFSPSQHSSRDSSMSSSTVSSTGDENDSLSTISC